MSAISPHAAPKLVLRGDDSLLDRVYQRVRYITAAPMTCLRGLTQIGTKTVKTPASFAGRDISHLRWDEQENTTKKWAAITGFEKLQRYGDNANFASKQLLEQNYPQLQVSDYYTVGTEEQKLPELDPTKRYVAFRLVTKELFGAHTAVLFLDKEKKTFSFFDSRGLTWRNWQSNQIYHNGWNTKSFKSIVEDIVTKYNIQGYSLLSNPVKLQNDNFRCFIHVFTYIVQRVEGMTDAQVSATKRSRRDLDGVIRGLRQKLLEEPTTLWNARALLGKMHSIHAVPYKKHSCLRISALLVRGGIFLLAPFLLIRGFPMNAFPLLKRILTNQ